MDLTMLLYAQRLDLEWVIACKACLGTTHKPTPCWGFTWEFLFSLRILDSQEVISTLMSTMNARTLMPLSTDMPAVLTPAMILTQKTSALSTTSTQQKSTQKIGTGSVSRRHFWKRWRGEYLATLKSQRNWIEDRSWRCYFAQG